MRLATVWDGGRPTAVVLHGDGALPIAGADGAYRDIGELLRSGERGLEDARRAQGSATPLGGGYSMLRPILEPGATFCVALNYRAHLRETGRDVPEAPIWFDKLPRALTDPDADILLPAGETAIDYEAELAVVIARPGRNVAPEEAWDLVAGVTLINDVSMRVLQRERQQVFYGKNLERSTPLGPAIVTMDEAGPFDALTFELRVNDEVRQRGDAADLLFDVPTMIADLSRVMTLSPGDVIATGTPSGIAAGMEPPRWLRGGDAIELEAARIGVLRNRFVDSKVRP